MNGYERPEHPVQLAAAESVAEWTGVAEAQLLRATDGCGVVVFGLPLQRMAAAYARLAAAYRRGDEIPVRIIDAIRTRPHLFGGTDRFDTVLLEETDGRVLAKVGAEGVHSVALLDAGLGLAVKAEDGAARAQYPAVLRALQLPRCAPRSAAAAAGRPPRAAGAEHPWRGGRIRRPGGMTVRETAPVRANAPAADDPVPHGRSPSFILPACDDETAALVGVAAAVAGGPEELQRDELRRALPLARAEWIEEVLLQSHLFAGFPRALNAMRLWRALSGRPAPAADPEVEQGTPANWRARGLETCAAVYGPFYERLRVNIAALHPALDAWMISDGYGRVLGRPALDLARRELCVVAACVAAQQDRQLHSHLHGALHVGAAPAAVERALEVACATVAGVIAPEAPARYRHLWAKVLGRHTPDASVHDDAASASIAPAALQAPSLPARG